MLITKVPDIDDVLKRLNTEGNKKHCTLFFNAELVAQTRFEARVEQALLTNELHQLTGIRNASNEAVIRKLELLPYMGTTTGGAVSFEKGYLNEALKSPYLSEEQRKGAELVLERAEHTAILSVFDSPNFGEYITPDPYLSGPDGCSILKTTKAQYAKQLSNRITLTHPAFGNWPGKAKKCLTTIWGFEGIAVDAGQLDPNNIFHSEYKDPVLSAFCKHYDDAYFGAVAYNMAPAHARLGTDVTSLEFPEVDDDMRARRAKLKTALNATNYGSENPEYQKILEHLAVHPKRLEILSKLQDQIQRGNYIVETHLGTKIDASQSKKFKKYLSAGKYDKAAALSFALRIQGTGADMNTVAVDRMLKLSKLLEPRSCIMTNIHDSLSFMVHKDSPHKEFLFDFIENDLLHHRMPDWPEGVTIKGDLETDKYFGRCSLW